MGVPFWIGDREFTQADIDLIRITVKEFFHLSREELTATICENLPWKAPNGRLKTEACRKLLLELERKGVITLPPLQKNKVRQVGGERLGKVIHTRLKAKLQEVAPVTIDPVTDWERADWNATMAAYHPLGYSRAIGAQQRYWIRVEGERGREIVGAMLFGAAAKAVAARDKWIGWTEEERRRYRPRIVNNNRFLILPEVHIPHLASHALSLVARRIRRDWRERYGYEPVLLETFVEPEYKGTCYRAANWIKIGETAGRGRQDTFKQYSVSVKTIWVYPLVRDWRRRLLEPFPEPTEETVEEGGE
ncbi:MAG: Druantia anti-phage system protein DruA [Moorellaceae bacterium]